MERAARESRRRCPLHASPWVVQVPSQARPLGDGAGRGGGGDGGTDAQSKSRSTPSLHSPSASASAAAAELQRQRQRRRECVRREIAFSPQGLFSRVTPSADRIGSETSSRYWEALRQQEDDLRAHVFAQTPVQNADGGAEAPTTPRAGQARLGSPAPAPSSESAANVGTATSSGQPAAQREASVADAGKKNFSVADRAKLHAMKKFTACMFDIREGLRVLILAGTPSPLSTLKTWPPSIRKARRHGTYEETLKVYHTYREVLAMESGAAAVEEEDPAAAAAAAAVATAADNENDDAATSSGVSIASRAAWQSGENLTPITWPTMFLWVEQKMGFTEDARIKGVCAAFLRALKHWRAAEAPPAQRYAGVYLHVMMKWIWPAVCPAGLAKMHTWICQKELEKIRVPTPPVINEQERKRIESLFKTMDKGGKGFCTAKDLAGEQDTIDPQTVSVVYGEDVKVFLNDFFEIMCSDNFRGHEEAKRVILDDGSKLVYASHDVVDWGGWVQFDVPPSEVAQRKRISELEAEIVRWGNAAGTAE